MPQSSPTPPLFRNLPPDRFKFFSGANVDTQKVVKFLRYKKEDVSAATDTVVSSVRYDDKMPEAVREWAGQMALAINLVGEFFKDAEKTALWFQASNPLLGGVAPRDMIRRGRWKKLISFIQTALEENTRGGEKAR